MKNRGINDLYNRFYVDLNFERRGLFELLKNKYNSSSVLYPGCSIHITPSFYFQHVVYVDISDMANTFFQDKNNILSTVNGSKKYKQQAYMHFINSDYTDQLTIRKSNYDLLIAIYAGGITKSCKKYIKPGGIIVTNNHHNDAVEIQKDSAFVLDALIQKKGKKYSIVESEHEGLVKILKGNNKISKNMKSTNNGMEYVDTEQYFIFRRIC